jgi:peptidylamidoglycolate lyase
MSSVNGLRKLEQMDKMAKVIARGKHFVGRN